MQGRFRKHAWAGQLRGAVLAWHWAETERHEIKMPRQAAPVTAISCACRGPRLMAV